MQLNRVGWFLMVLFLFIGANGLLIGLTSGNGFMTLWGGAFLAGGVAQAVFAVRSKRQAAREDEFHSDAIRGICTIVQVTQVGSVQDHPKLQLTVDVIVGDSPPSRAQTTVTVPDYAAFKLRPGLVLPVHVSPTDPSQVLVQW